MIDALAGDATALRALAVVVLLGAVCGPLGVWVLAFRQTYAAEALSHGMVPGLVAAALVGAPLAAGAAAGALAGAAGIGLVGRDRRLGSDLGVAVTITTALGVGALLAVGGPDPERLEGALFGDLVAVGPGQLAVSAALAALVLAGLAIGRRPLAACALDPVAAPSLGYRPAGVELAVLVGLAAALVAVVGALGSLLALALIVAPAGAARRLATRLGAVTALAAAVAIATGVVGLAFGLALGIEPGAVIALLAVTVFLIASRVHGGAASAPIPGESL